MRSLVSILVLIVSVCATGVASAELNIATFDQVMRLSPQARAKYLEALGQAIAEFEQRTQTKEDEFAVSHLEGLKEQFAALSQELQWLPQAQAADNPQAGSTRRAGVPTVAYTPGLPMTDPSIDDRGYQIACPNSSKFEYEFNSKIGTCVIKDYRNQAKDSPFAADLSCPGSHKAVGVRTLGGTGSLRNAVYDYSVYCATDGALALLEDKRRNALLERKADPLAIPATANAGDPSATAEMKANVFGGNANSEIQVASAPPAQESKPAVIEQSSEPVCDANFKCQKMNDEQKRQWRSDMQSQNKAECSVGGFISSYRHKKVKANNCILKSELTLGNKTAKCKPNETLCNPALYCNVRETVVATAETPLSKQVFCVSPRKVKGQVHKTCDALHRDSRPKDFGSNSSRAQECLSSMHTVGLRDLYRETIKSYENLCFAKDDYFRKFFCEECSFLSQAIVRANKDAFKKSCMVKEAPQSPETSESDASAIQ